MINLYHENPDLRVGDEIQTTAWIQYLYSKNIWLHYKDCNKYISSIKLFRDNSVSFCSANIYGLKKIDSISLWYWSMFLKENGFYTELNKKYEENETSLDVVFVPLIKSEYNCIRDMSIASVLNLFNELCNVNINVKMIISADKKSIINLSHENIIYSKSFEETFEYIAKSKIYIGGDTGVSHYAGAIRHPKMILIYGKEQEAHLRNAYQREMLAKYFNEPRLLKTIYSATPCCPQAYKLLWLQNNEIPVHQTLNALS